MDAKQKVSGRMERLRKLFFTTLYISAFTFGGGFVIVTFMKRKFVDELGWIDEQEMLDMTALAQASPGAIAVNAAILVGWKVEGLLGHDHPAHGGFVHYLVLLYCVRYQPVCGAGIEGYAGRCGGGHSGCGMRPGQ